MAGREIITPYASEHRKYSEILANRQNFLVFFN